MITGFSAWGHTALGWNRLSLCALPVKFRTTANHGGESVHRAKSAPARPAKFISNLLTLLKAQIETSSGAHAPEVPSVRSDSMIYRGSPATDAAERGKEGWSEAFYIRKLWSDHWSGKTQSWIKLLLMASLWTPRGDAAIWILLLKSALAGNHRASSHEMKCQLKCHLYLLKPFNQFSNLLFNLSNYQIIMAVLLSLYSEFRVFLWWSCIGNDDDNN